jgi:hypothetical protein
VGVVLLTKASREYSASLVAHEKGEHEGGRKGSRISPRERIRRAAAALRTFWVSGESSSSVCRWALRRLAQGKYVRLRCLDKVLSKERFTAAVVLGGWASHSRNLGKDGGSWPAKMRRGES